MLYVILGIVSLIIVLVLIVLINYLKMKELDDNINICNDSIIETLKNKQSLLDNLVRDAKEKKLISNLKVNDDINIFDFEQLLFDIKWNLNKIIQEEKYIPDKDHKPIIKDLNELEDGLEGLKDYYNSKSISYNELYYRKPFSYIYHLLKLEPKKTFKLRNLESLEILKN